MSFLPGDAQHIGSRNSQQDSFGFGDLNDEDFLAHGGFVAVVCDGMGGLEHGDLASRTAVRVFLDAYRLKTIDEAIPDALERSVRAANASVVAMAHELGAAESVGTTLVAASLLDSGKHKALYFISVGDSGIFHVSGGQMQTVNRPHTFASILDNAVARGTLTREQALLHPEREALTSFIGVETLEEIDRNVDPWPLRDGDTVLLASDGLFKTLTEAEIVATLHGCAPQKWPEALVARTLARQHEFQDNVTVLSVTIQDRPAAAVFPPPPAEAMNADEIPPSTQPGAPNVRWLWLMIPVAAFLIGAMVLLIVFLPKFLHRNDAVLAPAPVVSHAPLPPNPEPPKPPVNPDNVTQTQPQTADSITPPGTSVTPPDATSAYDTLVGQAATYVTTGDSESAANVYREAIKVAPQKPEAYAALGELYLYTIGNLPEALKYYHAAIARGGTVTFHVRHDRGGGNFTLAGDGRLLLSNSSVAYASETGSDSFKVLREEVKEAKHNKVLGIFARGQLSVFSFHIRLDSGKNYNFAPGSNFKEAERDLILNIITKGS